MEDDSIYTALIEVAGMVTTIPFVQAYQNGPRPNGAYGTLNIIESSDFGIDSLHQTVADIDNNVDINQDVIAKRVYTVSVNVFRAINPTEICNKIKAAMRSGKVERDVLTPANIGYVRSSQVRRLPEEVDGRFEDRAQFDLVLNVSMVYNSSFESIESAVITGSLEKADGQAKGITANITGE